MNLPFYTIGHSTLSLEAFIGELQGAEVTQVTDIRTVPRSRTNPQFNQDTLPGALLPYGISYEHAADLGGLRGKARSVDPDVNGLWRNDSFHNYADYALSPEFAAGLDALIQTGRERRTTVMCAEAVWWRCHRRIVSDYLLARGETVFHIMERGKIEPAQLTSGAIVHPDGTVTYPAKAV